MYRPLQIKEKLLHRLAGAYWKFDFDRRCLILTDGMEIVIYNGITCQFDANATIADFYKVDEFEIVEKTLKTFLQMGEPMIIFWINVRIKNDIIFPHPTLNFKTF